MRGLGQQQRMRERVLSRLREDVTEERRRVKEAIDKEVEDMRLSSHNVIDGLQQQEKRTMERIAALRGEIESYASSVPT